MRVCLDRRPHVQYFPVRVREIRGELPGEGPLYFGLCVKVGTFTRFQVSGVYRYRKVVSRATGSVLPFPVGVGVGFHGLLCGFPYFFIRATRVLRRVEHRRGLSHRVRPSRVSFLTVLVRYLVCR